MFPGVKNFTGNINFGLNNGGEYIRLYDELGFLMDSVYYSDTVPWPPEADGNGSTLSLLDYHLDNSLPENWFASANYGTPGRKNELVNSG